MKAAGLEDDNPNANGNVNKPHCSFEHHIHASERLKITVKLAPSCKYSNVTLDRMPMETETETETASDNTCSSNTLTSTRTLDQLSAGNKRKISSSCQEDTTIDASSAERQQQQQQKQQKQPTILSNNEILKRLHKGIPDEAPSNMNITQDYLQSPIGTTIYQYDYYNRDNRDDNRDDKDEFILCLANGTDQGVNEYHAQVQRLALWFIENADDVDLTSNQGGGAWKVLYLFRKHKLDLDLDLDHRKEDTSTTTSTNSSTFMNTGYSLAGYVTLFCFFSPFKKPKAGIVLRICQALVLPPYQRMGHGKRMMRAVYRYAKGDYDQVLTSVGGGGGGDTKSASATGESCAAGTTSSNGLQEIVEVNVEDPAPAFTYMRDAIDYEMFQDSNLHDHGMKTLLAKYLQDDDCFQPLTESDAASAAAIAKITKTQIQIAYEMYKLKRVAAMIMKDTLKKIGAGLSEDDHSSIRQELEKKYRLMVKKRLNHLHKEEIGACPTKAEKQAKLTELFGESYARYKSIVKV